MVCLQNIGLGNKEYPYGIFIFFWRNVSLAFLIAFEAWKYYYMYFLNSKNLICTLHIYRIFEKKYLDMGVVKIKHASFLLRQTI